jgi:hypothetical protein
MMNLTKRIRFFFTRGAIKHLSIHLLQILGVLWLFVEVASYFFTQMSEKKQQIFFGFVSLAVVWTLLRALPPVMHSKKSRSSDIEIEIKVGNLLEEPSNIAFGCSDCFDTEPEVVVGPNSLIAQLVRRFYKGDHQALDSHIFQYLNSNNISGKDDSTKLFGKKTRFDLGTVAIVPVQDYKAFLLVFSVTNDDKTTTTTKEDLWGSLCHLWAAIRRNGFLEPITVPVFGSGLARFPASRISLIQLLVLSFVIASREAKVSKKLTISIATQDYDPAEMVEVIEFLRTLDF